jgi:hypothetical protein
MKPWIFILFALVVAIAIGAAPAESADSATVELEYKPAPVNNPLKGLVPYAGDRSKWFPHSMEFSYLPLSALVKDDGIHDWQPLETLLNDIASRGHQAVFRIYLEYPGKTDVVPPYLVEGGLEMHRWKDEDKKWVETPDYANAQLRECLSDLVVELGRRYDGDPRIGFITAGLLGTWGEWHTYPREDLFAKRDVQAEVMEAYEAAFEKTPILLRYPAGNDHWQIANNAERPFGYHDDSFAWATLHTGKKKDEWFYMTELANAGALDKWKTQPIGGEIRPEAWGQVFDEHPKNKRIQDFAECVKVTHASWLMDSGLFEKKTYSDARAARAKALVCKMGYEFHVSKLRWAMADDAILVRTTIENRGVAPFYHAWPIEIAVLSRTGDILSTARNHQTLKGILPGRPTEWTHAVMPARDGTVLALRIDNPLKNGVPLRFANTTQDQHAKGWLSLAVIRDP